MPGISPVIRLGRGWLCRGTNTVKPQICAPVGLLFYLRKSGPRAPQMVTSGPRVPYSQLGDFTQRFSGIRSVSW